MFKKNITNIGVVYRNYKSKKREIELTKIAKACRKKRFKLYVSNALRLAIKVKADGVYIPAVNKINLFNNLQNKNFQFLD